MHFSLTVFNLKNTSFLHYSMLYWCIVFNSCYCLGYCMWLSISYSKFSKEMLSVRRSWCTFILKTPSWSLSHTFYRSCWDLRIMKLYSDTLQPCTIPCNHNLLQASFIQYIWFWNYTFLIIDFQNGGFFCLWEQSKCK